jgi:hypothetical protein
MPIPDSNYSTLDNIRTKVRRITRSPSAAQITDANIDSYVNNFVLYDFPEHLRLIALKTTFTFFTEPYIDTYETNTIDPTSPFYNFRNEYISVHPPMYIAGYSIFFSQSQEQYYNSYPRLNVIQKIGTGTGAPFNFIGVLRDKPVLRNKVLFSSIDAYNHATILADDGAGNLRVPNTVINSGIIDYVTGQYNFVFPVNPAVGQDVNAQTVPYVASRPYAVLFYDEKFTFSPTPDQAYRIEVGVFKRPTLLLADTDMPYITDFWQYIAYGACKKIFEDRMDMESINAIMPEFKQQERLVLRKTLMQQSNNRAATIYTELPRLGFGGGLGFGNGIY